MFDASGTADRGLTEDANLVLTLEEIANLAEQSGKPAETLMNVVALIAARFRTDVCSAYLLEPDRSNLVLAATLGLHPRSIGVLRMPLSEGLSGLVAEQVLPVAVADARNHPRYKYFEASGEEEYHSFLGVPLIDRGVLQGVLVVQTKEPRIFSDEEIDMLVEVAGQVAPVISEARTLDRFIAPAQEKLWELARNVSWAWDNDCTALFRDLNPSRWRELNQNPISLLGELPLGEIQRRAAELHLHSRINYVYRRQQEYLHADQTWGANHAGVLRPRPVAYFSAEFGLHESLPIYSGGLGVLAGDHIKSASDLDIPLVGVGLFYGQGYFLQRLDTTGWQHEEYLETDVSQLPMQPAIGVSGEPVVVEIATRGAAIRAKVWRVKVGRCDLAAARFKCRRQCARRSRNHLAALRRQFANAHTPGTAAGHRRISRAEGDGDFAWRAAPERGAQRLRGLRGHSRPHGRGGSGLLHSGAADSARGGVYHAYAGARRTRSLRRRTH